MPAAEFFEKLKFDVIIGNLAKWGFRVAMIVLFTIVGGALIYFYIYRRKFNINVVVFI